MIKKVLLILAIIFSLQVTMSCIFCNCPDTNTYDVIYNSASVTAINTSGFNYETVTDSVYKNAFGLEILISYDQVLSTTNNSSYFTLGFKPLMACSCNSNEYLFPDPVSDIQIFSINTLTNESVNVTSDFEVPVWHDEGMSIQGYIEQGIEWLTYLQVEMVEHEEIPSSVIFRVEVTLQSGTIFTDETSQVNFYN